MFVGNGSDEVLAHTFQALLKHDRPIRFPDITYSFYPTYARLYGVEYEAVPLAEDFSIRVEDYLGGRTAACCSRIRTRPPAAPCRSPTWSGSWRAIPTRW